MLTIKMQIKRTGIQWRHKQYLIKTGPAKELAERMESAYIELKDISQ